MTQTPSPAALRAAINRSATAAALRSVLIGPLRDAVGAAGAVLSEPLQGRWTVAAAAGEVAAIGSPQDPARPLPCGHLLDPDAPVHRCRVPRGRGHLMAVGLGHPVAWVACLVVARVTSFTEKDVALLQQAADASASALLTLRAEDRVAGQPHAIGSAVELAARLHQIATVSDTLRLTADVLQETLGARWVTVAWMDADRKILHVELQRTPEGDCSGVERPLGLGVLEEVWRTGSMLFLPGGAAEELERRGLTFEGRPRAWLGVPLEWRGAVRGVLALRDDERDWASGAEGVRAVEMVGRQLGIALSNLAALEEERRQRVAAEWLRRMARMATDDAQRPAHILEVCADAALEVVGGISSVVYIHSQREGTKRTLVQRGPGVERGAVVDTPLRGSPAGWVLQNQGATYVSVDISQDERLDARYRPESGQHAAAVVPIWSEGKISAFLSLARPAGQAFSQSEMNLLLQIADHAGTGYQTSRAVGALRQSEERYRRLLSTASDAIFTLDPSGRITSFNEAAERLSGLSASAAIGRRYDALLALTSRTEIERELHLVLGGVSRQFHAEVRGRNGENRAVALSISPLVEEGDVVAVLGIVRDVTDQRRMQAQLLQAEKMSAIGRLVGGMAHEINNPLASIAMNAELLQGEVADPHILESVRAIKDETDRAAAIVRNLLTYLRGQGAEKRGADLREAVERTVSLRRYQLRNQQIELEALLGSEPVMILGNAVNLQQVLMNLLVNAEQAIHGVGTAGHIRITLTVAGGKVLLAVEDDGPGVLPALLTRIFDPFFTTKAEGEGTGLGLSVSAGIVADHGGRLYVENRPQGGARFVVELPLAQEGEATSRAAPPPAGSSPGTATSGRRLLLIDDEPELRRTLAKFLGRLGWSVVPADSGQEGLRLLKTGEFQVVLCDLRMPGMSGHEFYRRLQAMASPVLDRLVFMTGDVVTPEAASFLADTARPVLSKPFGLEELFEILQRMPAA